MRIHSYRIAFMLMVMVSLGGASVHRAAAADFSWTFNINGMSDYRLTAVSSSSLYGGALPANDVTINLVVGRRYEVFFSLHALHPLQIAARGVTFGTDIVLLAQGSTVGTMEGDAGVAWTDNGAGLVTFTVTQRLLDAFTQGGRTAGYRCEIHPDQMRGAFNITPPPFDLQWTFSFNGLSDYRLTSVSSTHLYAGGLPVDDPVITLRVGWRYRITNAGGLSHPVQIAALGASSGLDTRLLGEGSNFFVLEDDPAIAWYDNGSGITEFTLTLPLFNAMSAGGLTPGYRCEAHPDDMRGYFTLETASGDWSVYE